MRLLDRLKAPGRNAYSIGLAHSADLTPRITRRPEPLLEHESCRVGGRVHAVVRRAGSAHYDPEGISNYYSSKAFSVSFVQLIT
jgi:hypothetical protein